jgi:hypothetical protein
MINPERRMSTSGRTMAGAAMTPVKNRRRVSSSILMGLALPHFCYMETIRLRSIQEGGGPLRRSAAFVGA